MTTTGYQLQIVSPAAEGGALDLMENDASGWRFDTLGQDATFGNAVPVSEVISSLMTDGSLTSIRSFGNRTATFLVTITAADQGDLATGEAELMSALNSVTALAWSGPWGPTSYFDVVAAWSEHVMDDLTEVLQMQRTYRLTFECLPFARSADPVTFTWTGAATEIPTSSMTGWTVVSGSATYNANAGGIGVPGILAGGSGAVLRRTVTADEYLWLKMFYPSNSFGNVIDIVPKIDGVTATSKRVELFGASSTTQFSTVATGGSRSLVFEFTMPASSALLEFWTRSYPGPAISSDVTRPKGVSVVDIIGTARTPCTIAFTAPAGGAFVYTAPDPNAAIRDRGAAEAVYAKFTVAAGDGTEVNVGGQLMWFPPGDHRTNIGTTTPQPLALAPNGVWPTQPSGAALSGVDITSGTQWSYPVDAKAAISFFDTTGSKTLISPSPLLPQGYYGDAVTHEQHALHPGRSGFAVLDTSGNPITTTVTYYPRWWSHAAQ